MPRLSAFYGIVIYMYMRDHGVAHFHARYGDDEAVFEIATSSVLQGGLPPRQARRVREWTELHRLELLDSWEKATRAEAPGTIDPLP